MSTDLPSATRVVVAGGGVIGCAVAWSLSRLGCSEVVVLEKGQVGCGTTWHSAGNIVRMSTDAAAVQLFSESANVVAQLHDRHHVGWRPCGRVMMARTEQRLREFSEVVDTLKSLNVSVERITPTEILEKLPMMNVDDILGALWSPGDGRVDPTALTNAYRKEAAESGVKFIEGVKVLRALEHDGTVAGVETNQGSIKCEVMVNCAGMWARDLGLANNIPIPLYPVEHFYVLTETMDGVSANMPTFRDPDGLIYGREEVGGLLLGCFDKNAIPVSTAELPQPFEFSLLNENWEQFAPYLEQGIHRVPALETVGVRSLVNGPESFTPDAEAHLDEAPELKNYFVLAGLSSSG
ncbi:MAG: FAD-dependent oxidoreductase, partial [Pseudomonadota bacterium]